MEKTNIPWTEIVIAIAAFGGFVLSIYNFITRRREDIPKVDVEISIGTLFYPPLCKESEPMIFLKAANIGKKNVTLGSYSIQLPDRNRAWILAPLSNVSFPYDLPSGKSCQIWTEVKEFAKQLKNEDYKGKIKLIGIFEDQVGNSYRSKPHILNVDNWSK